MVAQQSQPKAARRPEAQREALGFARRPAEDYRSAARRADNVLEVREEGDEVGHDECADEEAEGDQEVVPLGRAAGGKAVSDAAAAAAAARACKAHLVLGSAAVSGKAML